MKAKAVRACAETYDSRTLARAIEAITEREEELADVLVDGDDLGERLTHLLLAQRIRARMDSGATLKEAFRAEMGGVRDVLANEG